MSWKLPIPCDDEAQPVGELLALGLDQRIEGEEERHIVGHLLVETALEPGVETVKDLLSLPPQRKRALTGHAHLAGPEDHLPPPAPRYSPSGAIEFPGEREAEAERLRIQAEHREQTRKGQLAERAEDARAIKQFEDAMEAKWRSEFPEGLRGS